MILAIDPGGTTGLAWKVNDQYITRAEPVASEVYDFILYWKPDILLIEFFATRLISNYGLRTVELVGGVEAICYVNRINCIRRSPQHRYPGMAEANRILHATGKSHTDHQRDALAHIIAWERANAAKKNASKQR